MVHILPAFGPMRINEVTPLPIEKLLQSRLAGGLSPKTLRNLVGLLQSIFSLAVDNDLIARSPVRDRHKPRVIRREKPVWSAEQLKAYRRRRAENSPRLISMCDVDWRAAR